MPDTRSPPRGPRKRSRSPENASSRPRMGDERHHSDNRPRGGSGRERDDERDRRDSRRYDRDDDRRPRSGSRSRSPPLRAAPRKVKELSFYKKSGSSMGSFSSRRDPLDMEEETAKQRMERRERGEVPARFGGTREQGVRNTMTNLNTPSGPVGSLSRSRDPLERMGVKGQDGRESGRTDRDAGGSSNPKRDADKMREERMAAMDKPQAVAPSGSAARPQRFIEVIANSRMGGKVRVKCLPDDTVGDLKRLIAAQTGTSAQKIQLKKWYTNFKDHIKLRDYEINDGMVSTLMDDAEMQSLEMY